MIYLKNISTPQEVLIPKCIEADGVLVLLLKNTTNQSVTSFNVIDVGISDLYFCVSVELPTDMQSGEYEYALSDEMGELSTGLLFVGELSSPKEYKKVIQYEQC